ncbi:MAG: YSC84-related protein [Nitrospinales bacterium]
MKSEAIPVGKNPENIQRRLTAGLGLIILLLSTGSSYGATAKEINVGVDAALETFSKKVVGTDDLIRKAKGILVFPTVIKAGFFLGGEYGEGALRVKGKTVDYYNTVAASIGFQLGAQAKTVILAFMTNKALTQFRHSEGWEAGVDGSVALITVGAGSSINTNNIKDPILAFVFGQKGLMYNLTLEGSKFTKMDKRK